MKVFQTILMEKAVETGKAVLPVIGIVLILCFSIAPISPGILMAFLVGAVLLMAGMILFTLGVDMSMTPMGERVGTCMTKTRKLWIMVLMGFVLGFIITVSEPDLQTLATLLRLYHASADRLLRLESRPQARGLSADEAQLLALSRALPEGTRGEVSAMLRALAEHHREST